MAKSRFEAKKIVRYADNDINKVGISSRPTPRIQRSTSGVVGAGDSVSSDLGSVDTGTGTGLGSNTGVSETPPPPPPPVVVPNFTSSFYFDGATELTGSYSQVGGRDLYMGTIHTTIAPGWTQEETGSFPILTIRNKDIYTHPAVQYTRTFSIERTSGSNGYQDFLVSTISSGSTYYTHKGELDLSPNFYSGSGGTNTEQFLEFFFLKVPVSAYRRNGDIKSYKSTTVDFQGGVNGVANLALQAGVHIISVGGLHTTPNNYFKGSMANLSLAKSSAYYFKGGRMGDKADTNDQIDMLYRFEGNLSASRGGKDLEVIGTETYISSSL